jgi:hypothetical protein
LWLWLVRDHTGSKQLPKKNGSVLRKMKMPYSESRAGTWGYLARIYQLGAWEQNTLSQKTDLLATLSLRGICTLLEQPVNLNNRWRHYSHTKATGCRENEVVNFPSGLQPVDDSSVICCTNQIQATTLI